MRPANSGLTTMKTSFLRYSLLGIVIAAAGLSGCGGSIQGSCLVQRRFLPYGVVLDRQSLTGPAACNSVLPARLGDVWTFDKYGAEQTDLFFRPFSLTARVRFASGGEVFLPESLDTAHLDLATGKIGLTPDASGICPVPAMTEVRQDVVFVDEDDVTDPNNPVDTPEPPNPRSITVSSIKFLSAAQYQGAEFEVAVTYTNDDGGLGCSAQYTGLGMAPLVSCTDDTSCDPFADPTKGRATGSGINPAFPVTCNAQVGALFPVRFVPGAISTDNPPGVCWLTGSTFPVVK